MISLIVTNQFLKNICDSNAVTIKEQQLDQQRAHEVCRKQEDEFKSLESRLQKKEEENTQLLEELKKKTLSFKTIEGMIRKLNSTQDFQISKLSMQCS